EWAPRFPEISRAQLGGLLDDAAARFRRAGAGDHAIAKLRTVTHIYLGDAAALEPAYDAWRRLSRDHLSDCALCDDHAEVEVLEYRGGDEEAVAAIEAMLRSRRICEEVPHLTYATVLPPLLRLERREQAVTYQRRGYNLLKPLYDKNVGRIGDHLIAT